LDPADHAPEVAAELDARFGAPLAAAEREGRLERRAGAWRIAPRHRFVADEVIAWLLARARPLAAERAA
jgi:hypothetical protein